MPNYSSMHKEELQREFDALTQEYEGYKEQKLSLNMSRGKPATNQMDLTMPMLTCLDPDDMLFAGGMDARNYGALEGIPEARKLLADLMGLQPEEVLVCGSSSLNTMFDLVTHAYTHGVYGGSEPWMNCPHPKFLCPVPGYDRHFRITEYYHIDMIPIPMHEDGPDMELVEQYVNHDPFVKGIWCVPKYSNPQGITYSDEVVRRFAALKPAADDFRIFWDNAYLVHDLYEDDHDELLNIMDECRKLGSEDMVYEFFSTSKISFAGAGIAGVGASLPNIKFITKQFGVETIGWNKLNMLLHVRFFKDANGVYEHMKKHAKILRPKFETVLRILDENLTDLAEWTKPKGGYFIALITQNGCAKRTIDLCKSVGLTLTDAGAAFPYGHDLLDNTIRIAPTSVSVEELEEATEVLCLCTKIAVVEKLLAECEA
ncbi:MAG: aminotransferase class I/II-fold pyridoxal phosphate-dependent enzyme [Firmicutes bacterium]|nr:aminotransferase class I/II-fold pyridoxal phosphate-dependent enzyme [Bacillota bacterium]